MFSLLKTLCVPRFPQRKKAPKNSFDFAYPICCHPAPRTQNFRDRLLYTWTLATIGGWRQGRLRHRIKFGAAGLPGGLPPPRPPGGAGDGNNNAGAAFGGAPAALRAAGVVVPVPDPAPPGVLGAGVTQEGQPPRTFVTARSWWPSFVGRPSPGHRAFHRGST